MLGENCFVVGGVKFNTCEYWKSFGSEPSGRKYWGFFLYRGNRKNQGHPDERAVRFETGECDWKRAKKKALKRAEEIGRDYAEVYVVTV